MSRCVVGVDVGGTSIKVVTVDERSTVLDFRCHPTERSQGPDAVVERIVGIVREEVARARTAGQHVVAAGVVVPGIVDEDAGVAVLSANLGWRDVPLLDLLRAHLDVPVGFGHDVRAGGLAECEVGAARGLRDILFLAIGTGVSGALILGGRPYPGHGYAGELGHVVVRPDGRRCPCGAFGCLETVASAAAIAAHYAERTGLAVDALEISRRVAGGDADASAVWSEAVDALASALALYVGVLAPDAIVLGGGLAQAGSTLFGPLTVALDRRLTFHRRPRLLPAELGDRAGAVGATLVGRRAAGGT